MQDEPDHSPRSTKFIRAIADGSRSVHVTDQVIFEAIHLMEKFYKVPRHSIESLLAEFIDLETVQLAGKQRWARVLSLYATTKISAVDAFHAVFMRLEGISEIVSFDTDFDSIPNITRIEP